MDSTELQQAVGFVRERIAAREEVSAELMVDLCRALGWKVTTRTMPGQDTIATVTVHGTPFTSRGPSLGASLLAALERALEYAPPE